MKRIVSDAENILTSACIRNNVQEESIYRNTKQLLQSIQRFVWSEQKEQKTADNCVCKNAEVLNELLRQLQYFPVVGYLYADILRLSYFSNISSSSLTVRKMTGLSETAFYKRKKQAILALGLTLAGMMDRDTLEEIFSLKDHSAALALLTKNVRCQGEMLRAS